MFVRYQADVSFNDDDLPILSDDDAPTKPAPLIKATSGGVGGASGMVSPPYSGLGGTAAAAATAATTAPVAASSMFGTEDRPRTASVASSRFEDTHTPSDGPTAETPVPPTPAADEGIWLSCIGHALQ